MISDAPLCLTVDAGRFGSSPRSPQLLVIVGPSPVCRAALMRFFRECVFLAGHCFCGLQNRYLESLNSRRASCAGPQACADFQATRWSQLSYAC